MVFDANGALTAITGYLSFVAFSIKLALYFKRMAPMLVCSKV